MKTRDKKRPARRLSAPNPLRSGYVPLSTLRAQVRGEVKSYFATLAGAPPPTLNFNPDQPRDERGRFGSGGSATAAPPTTKPKRVVRGPNTTHEGVPLEKAGKLTREEAREALEFKDGMTLVEGSNRPNPALPGGTRPQLTDLERGALQKYSYLNDRPLNARLRGRGDWRKDTPYSAEYFDEMHEQMQSAFRKAPVLDKPVRVVRGMKLGPDQLKEFVANVESALESGGDIAFSGYTSTTRPGGLLYKMGLSSGVEGPFRGNVSLKINAVHGLDMMPHSQLSGESEMLLNHGSRYKVKSVVKKRDGYHVELDQLPPAGSGVANAAPAFTVNVSEREERDLKRFYREHPEALGKWLDEDADFIDFRPGRPSAAPAKSEPISDELREFSRFLSESGGLPGDGSKE